MKNSDFLDWIADRIVFVYGESPNVDFVHRLREIAEHERKCDRQPPPDPARKGGDAW